MKLLINEIYFFVCTNCDDLVTLHYWWYVFLYLIFLFFSDVVMNSVVIWSKVQYMQFDIRFNGTVDTCFEVQYTTSLRCYFERWLLHHLVRADIFLPHFGLMP